MADPTVTIVLTLFVEEGPSAQVELILNSKWPGVYL